MTSQWEAGSPPLAGIRGIIFDVDGTLACEDVPLPGAAALLGRLNDAGIAAAVASNGTWRAGETLRVELAAHGLEFGSGRVLSVLDVLAEWLRERRHLRTAGVLGFPPLHAVVRQAGLVIRERGEVDVVVVGKVPNDGWQELPRIAEMLYSPATYVATSVDRIGTRPDGSVSAGAGAVVGALWGMTARTPDIVLGKPSPRLLELAAAQLGVPPRHCAVVGDSIQTDVNGARAAGMVPVLVRSGVAPVEERATWLGEDGSSPDALSVSSLEDLLEALSALIST